MSCKKCPHHVRHGQVIAGQQGIEFKDRCGLKMKELKPVDCAHHPFAKGFDYTGCSIYQDVFKSTGQRNDAIPTSDFQYSEKLTGNSITEMELL